MRVIAVRVVLDFHGNTVVAEKHRLLSELCADLREEFNVSALEIADFDDRERCVLGLSAVVPDSWKATAVESFVEKLCARLDATAGARVTSEERELFEL